MSDEGMFDLAPGKTFRVAGRNAVLPGDVGQGTETRAHTSVFYDERRANAILKGGFEPSRKDNDKKIPQTDNAKTRLAKCCASRRFWRTCLAASAPSRIP